jgi:hypothetical protein
VQYLSSARVQISAALSSGTPEESAQAWQNSSDISNSYYKIPKNSLQMIMRIYQYLEPLPLSHLLLLHFSSPSPSSSSVIISSLKT